MIIAWLYFLSLACITLMSCDPFVYTPPLTILTILSYSFVLPRLIYACTLRHSKIFCHEFFSTSVHTHVEEEKGHVSTLVAAQVSESHENEALSDDRDVVLQQPKERKTISTLWQAIKSAHRTRKSGGLSALNREDTSSCVWSGLHAFDLHGQHVHRCRNWGRHRGHAPDFTKGAKWYVDQIDL